MPVYFVQEHTKPAAGPNFSGNGSGCSTLPANTSSELPISGHRPLFEQPDEFIDYMNNTVLLLPHRPS